MATMVERGYDQRIWSPLAWRTLIANIRVLKTNLDYAIRACSGIYWHHESISRMSMTWWGVCISLSWYTRAVRNSCSMRALMISVTKFETLIPFSRVNMNSCRNLCVDILPIFLTNFYLNATACTSLSMSCIQGNQGLTPTFPTFLITQSLIALIDQMGGTRWRCSSPMHNVGHEDLSAKCWYWWLSRSCSLGSESQRVCIVAIALQQAVYSNCLFIHLFGVSPLWKYTSICLVYPQTFKTPQFLKITGHFWLDRDSDDV